MKTTTPNFLIVGAAKSGTSSLHNYLNQHPDIFMPSKNKAGINFKEPQFLIKELVQKRLHFGVWNWEEYLTLFKPAATHKKVGESSVFYLYYYKLAIKNIKKYLGNDIKIIIILRNPVDRAFSAYNHVSKSAIERFSFEEALALEALRLKNDLTLTPMVMYKDMGLYYKMVKAYKDAFKCVHVILFDDFIENTENEMQKVFTFLEVNPRQKLDFTKKYNSRSRIIKNNYIRQFFLGDHILKRVFKKILPEEKRRFLFRELSKIPTSKSVPMKKETRKLLINHFEKDIEKLSALLKIDLTNWKK